MVEERLELEKEVQEILTTIDNKRNFLLSGGAGSGKTYSLVQLIRQLIQENPTAHIACMTYTNAAVKEIESRVDNKQLNVTTIHDFLWDNIKHFQNELKLVIIDLVNDETEKKIRIYDENPIGDKYFDQLHKGIQYREHVNLKDGIISHDELIIIAHCMFAKYPKLCDILKDRYRYILVDEYQDTDKLVVDIFLVHLRQSKKHNTIGFFGDAMQCIYEKKVGDLKDYTGTTPETVQEIKKTQNRRSPQKVIDLANLIRTDGIQQVISTDSKAPNMFEGRIKPGNILFLYSKDKNKGIENARAFLSTRFQWNFEDSKRTKELNLTHNLIAEKAEFPILMSIYDDDPIIALKNEILEKIKENKKKGIEAEIGEDETFEQVTERYPLENKNGDKKKDIILADPEKNILFNKLKNKTFLEVKRIYINKESLLDDKKQDETDIEKKGQKRDDLIRHLFNIQKSIFLYLDGQYNLFLRKTDYRFKINTIESKRQLKKNIEELTNVGDKSIEEVIIDADIKGITLIDDRLKRFMVKEEYLYERVKKVRFSEFQKLYQYLEGRTPFSTQHKTKGAEFDNVFVILDNGEWTWYNFPNLFLQTGTPSVLKRTQKIFYVCCTRTKENLAVYFHAPQDAVITKARTWFGKTNVIDLDL